MIELELDEIEGVILDEVKGEIIGLGFSSGACLNSAKSWSLSYKVGFIVFPLLIQVLILIFVFS